MEPERGRRWQGGAVAAILALAAVTPAHAGVCLSCGSGGSSGGSGGGSPPPPPPPPIIPGASGFVSVNGHLDTSGGIETTYGDYTGLPAEASSLTDSGGASSAAASLTLGSDPSAVATAEASYPSGVGTGAGAQAQVYYTYDFAIGGPAGATALVDMTSQLTASESGDGPYAVAGANITIVDTTTGSPPGGYTLPAVCAAVGASCAYGGSDAVTQQIYVPVGDVIAVYLNANVDVTDGVSGTSVTATASIDPTFTIDPTFLTANPGYTLTYGQGVLGVPEPGVWGLMLVGLGLSGLAIRTRRRLTA
jgi:hypothetical protein